MSVSKIGFGFTLAVAAVRLAALAVAKAVSQRDSVLQRSMSGARSSGTRESKGAGTASGSSSDTDDLFRDPGPRRPALLESS